MLGYIAEKISARYNVKKIHIISITALAAAAAAVPLVIKRRRQKKNNVSPEDIRISVTPVTDFKDKDHLIFCDETNLSRRLINLDNTINMRDIGGYTGLEGRKTKWGRVIRSEALCHLSDSDFDALAKMGIKHVYDFRDADKAQKTNERIPDGADYTNLPVLEGLDIDIKDVDFAHDPKAIDKFFRKVYTLQVTDKAPQYAVVLKTLTDEKETPILYHCTNGKDRTGFMTALILLICGVPEETIISDYTLTNLTFDEAYDKLGDIASENLNKNASFNIPKIKLHDFFGVDPNWIKIQLDYIRDNYQNVDNYLIKNTDLTKADLDAIRETMLEPIQ